MEEIVKRLKKWDLLFTIVGSIECAMAVVGLILLLFEKTKYTGIYTIFTVCISFIIFIIVNKVVTTILYKMYNDCYKSLSSEDKLKKLGLNISIKNDEKGQTVDELLNGETVKLDLHEHNVFPLNGQIEVKFVKDE